MLGGAFAVLHRLEHLLGILLTHAALLLLLFLLVLLLLILILLVLVLVFVLVLLILIFVLVLVFVLILVLVFIILILVLILVFVLILVVLILVLLLFLELGQAQVVTGLVVIGVAAQGVLVEFYRLAVVLAAIGDIAQVIAGLAAQLLVLSAFGKIGEQSFGLLHRVFLVVLFGSGASLPHECSGEVELRFLAGRVGLQGLAVLYLGLGIAFFLIQLIAVAQGYALLLGHFGGFALCHGGQRHGQRQDGGQCDGERYFICYLEFHLCG